jgi:hypothetical protein
MEIKYQNRTEFLGWNESPTTTVFGKNIPVTYLINSDKVIQVQNRAKKLMKQ